MHFGKGAWGDARNASIMYVNTSLLFISTQRLVHAQHNNGEAWLLLNAETN